MPLHGALFVIYLVIIVVKVFALVDAVRRPERNFVIHEKQTKQFWMVVLVLALLTSWLGFLNLVGLVAALVYLLDVRPAVAGR
ncbi:MAG TPA: DUF2516 family protein [Mycobacteriales bacterium]|jgi:uncharacterized membrane protein YkvI|nr:DUF2516 family protein [Mycobacteriales bacterium]